ncbi:restriction endonuclease subunit S [Lacticaseibacillus rhamnosus]|uniref:restriction endonuclease subunit S n=1 Tax=Lacticaseibacillus rhamnosus TaxID=47715 RepID=UPI003456AEE2
MNAEQHVPPFRFKGFSDFWEQRKLSDLAMFNPRLELPDSFQYVDLESVSGTELINHRTETKSSAPSRAQRLAKKGDIFYQTVRPYQKNNYLYEKSDDDYVFSTGYAQLRPYEDGYFLFSRLQENGFVSTVLDHSTGTSYPAINSNDLAKLEIMVPLNLNEQQAIGKLFRHIDNAIALHQHKLAKLKELKKGYLQKLFPQNGETVPEFRFKGYSDAWEKRKYGDIAKSFQYGLNAPAKKFDGINKYLRITDIDDLTRLFKQESLTSPDTNLSNASTYLLKQGDVLFARTGASTGKTYKYRKGDGKVYFAGFLIRADLKPKFDSEFFYQTTLTDSFLDFVKVTSQRSGQPGINSKEYANKAIQVPELSEQQRIGSVLAIYDNLIAATQHKVDLLKKLKQGYLQKMFC